MHFNKQCLVCVSVKCASSIQPGMHSNICLFFSKFQKTLKFTIKYLELQINRFECLHSYKIKPFPETYVSQISKHFVCTVFLFEMFCLFWYLFPTLDNDVFEGVEEGP